MLIVLSLSIVLTKGIINQDTEHLIILSLKLLMRQIFVGLDISNAPAGDKNSLMAFP